MAEQFATQFHNITIHRPIGSDKFKAPSYEEEVRECEAHHWHLIKEVRHWNNGTDMMAKVIVHDDSVSPS
jgi:hypothetical protein